MPTNQVQQLIALLQKEGPLSVKTASMKLNVSERSIRNYIHQANAASLNIHKDHSKLWVEHTKKIQPIQTDLSLPQNYKERSRYMIKKRIINDETVDLFELSDKLFVSYSTLKNDISKMNQEYQQFQIHFRLKNDQLFLDGSEKQIRKLISHVLADETASHTVNLETLIKNYDPFIVQTITEAIDQMIDHPSVLKNDLARMNLILHLVIISQRSKKRDKINNPSKEDGEKESRFTMLVSRLERTLMIQYSQEDLEQIHTLLAGNINYDRSKFSVSDEIEQFSNALIDLLETRYHVELGSDMNKEMFFRHVYNLLIRAKTNSYIKNPMKESIKAASPTIYEMAILASIEFEHQFHFHISEDEIAFIAIHISNWINQSNELSNKLNVILLCPGYLNIQTTIVQTISSKFADDLIIIKTISSEQELDHLQYDLLISTIPLTKITRYPFIMISPILTNANISALAQKLEEIKRKKESELIRSHFFEYFDEKLFFRNDLRSKDEILSFLCNSLVKQDVIDMNFEQSVRERETVCSTAFSLFAIPHPLMPLATQTKIPVFINPNGIDWNGTKVQIVLLLAINEVDKRIFMNVYEPLIRLLSENELTATLARSNSFRAFANLLLEKM